LDFRLLTGGAEELLDALGGVLPTGGAFKEEGLGVVDLHGLPDQILEVVRQGDLPVFVVFGLADDQRVAFPIDIALAQLHGFRDAQAA